MKLGLFFSIYFVLQCTENLFDENIFSTDDSRVISGIVSLDSDPDPSGVLIWLDKFNLYTFSDDSGRYSFKLPEKSGEIGTGYTDFATIYYYVSNYALDSSSIYIFNGAFKNGVKDIDENGLIKKINLKKILEINTFISPDSIIKSEYSAIVVTVNLKTAEGIITDADTWLTKAGALASIYIKALDDRQEAYLIKNSVRLTRNRISESLQLSGVFILDSIPLNNGLYEIFPYIWIDQNLPSGLLDFYGDFVTEFTSRNLSLPVRRQNAVLNVQEF